MAPLGKWSRLLFTVVELRNHIKNHFSTSLFFVALYFFPISPISFYFFEISPISHQNFRKITLLFFWPPRKEFFLFVPVLYRVYRCLHHVPCHFTHPNYLLTPAHPHHLQQWLYLPNLQPVSKQIYFLTLLNLQILHNTPYGKLSTSPFSVWKQMLCKAIKKQGTAIPAAPCPGCYYFFAGIPQRFASALPMALMHGTSLKYWPSCPRNTWAISIPWGV